MDPEDENTSAGREVRPEMRPEVRPDVARLAHELRTPLGAISVLAEIMRDERLGPLGRKYRDYAADIHQSAAHATSVLAGWLEAAASNEAVGQTTGGSLDFVELEPAELVASTVSTLGPLAARAGVRLVAEFGPGLPRLIADRRSMRQILDNLIANALKFTPPGGDITVRISHLPGRALEIEVADTGDGMTPAELSHARSSDPAPQALRQRSGGSGTGLVLVRALAAAGGATLRIDSSPGQGTQVTVAYGADRILPV